VKYPARNLQCELDWYTFSACREGNIGFPANHEDSICHLTISTQLVPRGLCGAAAALFLATFVVLAAPASASPQGVRIEGVVRDASGAPVAGAHVELHSNSYTAKVITTSAGAFAFENVPCSAGTIDVISPGFNQEHQSWNTGSGVIERLEVVLKPSSVNQQVVVTAARTSTPIGETPASDIQLTSAELQATPALALDDVLRQIPGFSLFRRTSSRTANPTTLGVSLRGLGANGASRVLVLEDGVPLNDPFGAWVYWDRVPAASVSTVEVAEEGASSLYGSEALGGVIQFLLRPSVPKDISLDISYGNQNTQDVSLSAGASPGRWEFVISGEAFHTNGYVPVPNADQGSVDTHAGSQHGTVNLTVGRKIGAQSDVFARGSYFDDSRNNGTVNQTNDIRLAEGVLGADLDLGSGGTVQFRSYGDFEIYHQSFFSVALNQNSEELTDFQTVPAQGVGASAVWSRGLGRQTLVAGFDDHEEIGHSNEEIFSSTSGSNTKDTATGGHQRTTGLFGEDLIQVAPRWTLALSARLDNWSNFDAFLITEPITPSGATVSTSYTNRSYNAFSPRASLVHQVNPNISWSASAYRAFRAPTLNELYRSFRQANNLTDANAGLTAERLSGGETSIALQGLSRRLQARGSFFFNEIVDPISSISCQVTPTPSICPPPTTNTLTFVRANLGRTAAPGFELDWLAQISNRFQLAGGFQYVDAMIISAPGQPSLVNTWVAQVPHSALTFQARYANPAFVSFSVEGRFVGMQLDTDQIPMGRYFVVDAMASRALPRGVEVFAAIENLFNQQYVSTAATSLSPPQIGLPIAARFGVRLNLFSKK
jgi:outer membrane receptor protein involved in Fe transport